MAPALPVNVARSLVVRRRSSAEALAQGTIASCPMQGSPALPLVVCRLTCRPVGDDNTEEISLPPGATEIAPTVYGGAFRLAWRGAGRRAVAARRPRGGEKCPACVADAWRRR